MGEHQTHNVFKTLEEQTICLTNIEEQYPLFRWYLMIFQYVSLNLKQSGNKKHKINHIIVKIMEVFEQEVEQTKIEQLIN